MDVNNFSNTRRAVSPVIATILLVAVTVVIAASIGVTVLGTGSYLSDPAPQANFEFVFEKNGTDYVQPGEPTPPSWGYDMDKLTVRHVSGENIPSGRVRIETDGTDIKYINSSGYLGDLGDGKYQPGYTFEQIETEDSFSAGDSFVVVTFPVDEDQDNVAGLNEASARIVYEPESSDRSLTLATWEGPDY